MLVELRSLPPCAWQEMVKHCPGSPWGAGLACAGSIPGRVRRDVCGTGTQRLPSGLSWLSWTRHGINREASSRMCKVKGAPVCREAGKRPKGPQDRSLDSKATCLLNMEKGKEAAYA